MSTILVVEDTQDNFDLIEDALDGRYTLLHARNGLEAIGEAARSKPDLILLDMGLPEMNGWEVVRRLKANPDLKEIRVIALTAHAMDGDRKRCLEAGCDEYMSKPIGVTEVIKLVETWIASEDVVAHEQE